MNITSIKEFLFSKIHPFNKLTGIEILITSTFKFENSISNTKIIISVEDAKIWANIVDLVKKEQHNFSNVLFNVAYNDKVTKFETFSSDYFSHITSMEEQNIPIRTYIENLFIFVDDEDFLSVVINIQKLKYAANLNFNITYVAKSKDEQALKILNEKGEIYDSERYCYYNGSMEQIKKQYGITENIFGFIMDQKREIRYILKKISDFEDLAECYKKLRTISVLTQEKRQIAKPENKADIQNKKLNQIITNLTQIYKLCNNKIKLHEFYYKTCSLLINNEEFTDISYKVEVTVLNQHIFRDLIPLIEPIQDNLPNVTELNFIFHYLVDYHFLADLTFQEGKKCVNCQKVITKKESYYICYICKIEKKDYIVCSSCYEGVDQHKHPLIYIPIEGHKYLSNLTNLRAIQEEADPDFGSPLTMECWRCGIPMNTIAYYCCICKDLQFCPKCYLEFKEGEYYQYFDKDTLHHLNEHPMLITSDKWSCGDMIIFYQYYKENIDNYFSYLYDPQKR